MPDGASIVATTRTGEVNFWPIPEAQHPLRLSRHPGPLRSLVFSKQGDVLLSGGDYEVRRWNFESGQLVYEHGTFGTGNLFVSAVFDEREENVLAMDDSGKIHTWSFDSVRDEIGLLCNSCANGYTSNVGFSNNGQYALVHKSSLVLGEVQDLTTDFLRPFGIQSLDTLYFTRARSIIFSGPRVSPDGRWALYVEFPNVNAAQLWDADNNEMVHELAGHTSRIKAFDFTADNQFVLTASDDGTIRIWNIDSGLEVQRLVTPNVRILSAVFSADGRFVLTGDNHDLARLWNLESGEQIRVFGGQHQDGVTAVAFSPDSQQIATGDGAGDVRIWDINLETIISLTCAQLPRDFTAVELELFGIPPNTPTC
jgi:WD40 repeat protein